MPLLSRAVRNARAMMRAQEWGTESVIPPNSGGPSFRSGGGIETAALSISTLLACVKALYDDMSVVPFAACVGDRRGAHQQLDTQPHIIEEPFGPDLDVGLGIGQIVVSRSMRGNAYLFVSNRIAGDVDQVIVLHPDLCKATRNSKGYKVVKVGAEEYGPDEIIHIPGLMMPGAVAGVDVITAQRLNLELAREVVEYGHEFFAGGGSPSGVVSVSGSGDRKKAREIKDIWESEHGGVQNAHRPAVMFGGATWTQLSVTPDNAQFLATREYSRVEICGLFSVPLQRIQAIVDNASQGGGKGLEAIDAGYVQHGLLPHGSAIERAFSRLLPGGQRTFAKFDYDEFLRANAEIRAKVAQAHRVTGVRIIDEIRADEGWAPLPDGQGQDPFTPLNSNTSPTGGENNDPNLGGGGNQ